MAAKKNGQFPLAVRGVVASMGQERQGASSARGMHRGVLQSVGPGPNRWRWGVLHPLGTGGMTAMDKERREELEDRLRSQLEPGGSESWWPYVRQVSDEMTRWDSLLPDLYREWKAGHGPITDYYVDGMMDLATNAIPVIDEVEREWKQAKLEEQGS
ncbi:hypothetical protein [Candidatus Palauibacter sp.]|uniref:hypothetical protein n=1 Tax=Candidatus Palauibacter sp. TaxID=3101350 RepID=UPI003AF1F9FC